MQNVLCFGDSNTWGYVPIKGTRLAPETRWPGIAQEALGNSYRLIEDGLNGRTTVYDDPASGNRNGGEQLAVSLLVNKPLDWVALMLGTNDLKFTNALGASDGMAALLRIIRCADLMLPGRSPVFGKKPKVLVISPIALGQMVDEDECSSVRGKYGESLKFGRLYSAVASDMGALFLDAARIAAPSPEDGMHMTPDGHRALGLAIADAIARADS